MSVKVSLAYQGDLRTKATHGPSGQELITDAPVDNQGRGESFSPTDLVGTALGSCMMTIMGIAAQRKEIDLTGLRVEVEKEMTPPPRRIARLTVDLYVPLPSTHPERQLLENAALTCPVHRSLAPEVEQVVHFHYSD